MAINPNRPVEECECADCKCYYEESFALCGLPGCECCEGEDCHKTK
mgnify:CR=1 FL=1|tara:strand:+ start:280 stop:417 length:138 start_codon:yes stop_codon:yes gene_type:complete